MLTRLKAVLLNKKFRWNKNKHINTSYNPIKFNHVRSTAKKTWKMYELQITKQFTKNDKPIIEQRISRVLSRILNARVNWYI